jgi:hypothetical protein
MKFGCHLHVEIVENCIEIALARRFWVWKNTPGRRRVTSCAAFAFREIECLLSRRIMRYDRVYVVDENSVAEKYKSPYIRCRAHIHPSGIQT